MRHSTPYHMNQRLAGLVLLYIQGCQSPALAPRPAGEAASGDVARSQALARVDTDEAFKLIGENQFDPAEDLLKKALAADPLYGPAHNDMGLVHYHRENLYDAAWEFENAARLMPQQAAPANNLGLVLEKADKLDEAEKAYANAVALDAQSSEYAGNYARARIRLGQRDETTKKLLDLIIMRDHRPDWVAWAREQASRIAKDDPGSADRLP